MNPPKSEAVWPTVHLRHGEAERIQAGHPWIYARNIQKVTQDPSDGSVVQVRDHRRRFLGVGFFNGQSKIRVRLLSREKQDLDKTFFVRKCQQALLWRQRHLPNRACFRLIHAEGDGLSGLTVDCYGDQLVVQTTSLGMDQRLPMITEALVEVMAPSRIIERNDSIGRSMEGLEPRKSVLYQKQRSSFGDSVRVEMNGLEWDIPLDQGHKTAVYLDQYENYRRLGELTASMKAPRVLDAFTFMGGFALHCAKAGASKVIAIDQSQEALQAADQSARANDLEPQCEWIHGNVFDWLKEHSKEPDADSLFDLIILDPPSFTRNRRSMGDAMRGYKEIHLRAMRLLKPGGLLATFCCSHHIDAQAFESSVIQAAMDNRWILRRVASFGQPADHPVVPSIPETQYLKGFCYQRLEDGFIADPEGPSARA